MRSIHYSVADNYVFGNLNVSKVINFCILITANVHISKYVNILLKDAEVNIQSNIDGTENIYDEAHQRDDGDETINVYSVSEPQCHHHREEQDSDNDTYSHLHHKPLQMSDDVYGVPSSILVPSSSKSQENTVSE